MFLIHIPNGKRIWFWYKTAPAAEANYLRIRRQYKNSAYSQQSGPISNIVLTDLILNFIMVLNLKKIKKFKKNYEVTVQAEQLYEKI